MKVENMIAGKSCHFVLRIKS